jgi:prepilin-type N-terminal cleavage/methylation domain-containing protein
MRSKGFTLIELLAVIVILAIVLAIAIPSISGIMNSSTKSAFESDAKLVLKTLDYKVAQNDTFDVASVNETNISSLLGINEENYSRVTFTLVDGSLYTIIIGQNKWDGLIACGFYTNMDVVENQSDCRTDLMPPIITLNGDSIININVGETYSDAGSSASDNIDGDITNQIVTSGTVNTTIPGTYTITYSVTDADGNTSTVTRTINVIDNSLPIVTFNPNGNSAYAKSRSTIVTINDEETIDASSLKYLWTTSTTAPSEASFTTSFTSGDAIASPDGVTGGYYLWILGKDNTGKTSITHSDVFNLDNTVPVIIMNGSNPASINVGGIYADAGATASDNIDGTIDVVSTGTVDPNVMGTYTITYTATDSSGNTATSTRTVNVVDNVAPTVAFGTNGNSTYAKSRSTTATVSDASGLNTSSLKYLWNTSTTAPSEASFTTSFTNGGTITSPAGVTGGYYLWILAKDTSGNATIIKSNVFNLDNTKPVITMNGSNPVTINKGSTYTDAGATATDTNSGISGSVTSTGSVNPSVVGTYTITYNVSDNAGNAATPVTRTINVVDNQAPVITLNGSTPVNINVGSTYSDAGATAIDDIDGDVTSNIVVTGTVNPSVIGTYTITYTVKDSANNTATSTRTVNVIDNVVPTVAFGTNGNSTWAKSRSTTATVSDNVSVNTSSLKYQWTTSTTAPSEASFTTSFTNGGTITSPAGVTGTYYLWILGKDNASNTMIARSNVFNLDNTAPIITLNGSNPVNINVGSTYSDAGATATDTNSGISGSVTSTGSVNPSVMGTYTITYTATDNAGNTATSTRTVNVIDNVAPTVAFNPNGNSTSAKTRSTTVTVSDENLDTSSLKYLWNTSTISPSEASFTTSFTSGDTITSPDGVTGTYYLWILAKDNFNNTTITSSSVFNLDNTAPVITMNGSNPANIALGSTYSDAGASATDSIDGTVNVTSTGTVDPNVIGTYTITYDATDTAGNTATVIRTVNVAEIFSGPGYIASKGANGPVLATGMTPIKWNGTSWINTTINDSDWYNYTTTDKKWANAKTADGSMWVWIPRYIYNISSGWHSSTAGTINVQFSMGTDDTRGGTVTLDTGTTSNASNNKWTDHPAFAFGTTELTGIWVAKFEPTASEGVANGYTSDWSCPITGDNVTTKTIKVLPNAKSWRCIQVGNSFTAVRNMETKSIYGWATASGLQSNGSFTTDNNDVDTHLMKNSEWGASTYLSKSGYGQGTNEIYINNNQNYITGCAGSTATAGGYNGCQNTYDSATGVKASTTGNIYGIYDLSGNSWERVSAYLNNGDGNLAGKGSSIINANGKYKEVYSKGSSDAKELNYPLTINFKGDAYYETSNSYTGSTAWFGDYTYMLNTTGPWEIRGGAWNMGSTSGAFGFANADGSTYSHQGFRPVLLVNEGL